MYRELTCRLDVCGSTQRRAPSVDDSSSPDDPERFLPPSRYRSPSRCLPLSSPSCALANHLSSLARSPSALPQASGAGLVCVARRPVCRVRATCRAVVCVVCDVCGVECVSRVMRWYVCERACVRERFLLVSTRVHTSHALKRARARAHTHTHTHQTERGDWV